MSRVRRTFTPEFKRNAVRSLLQGWIEQHAEQDGTGNPRRVRGSESEELKKLQKQLRDVTEERDILKKALAYFADDQK
jgi:transposase